MDDICITGENNADGLSRLSLKAVGIEANPEEANSKHSSTGGLASDHHRFEDGHQQRPSVVTSDSVNACAPS